jgi:hypothetical protein
MMMPMMAPQPMPQQQRPQLMAGGYVPPRLTPPGRTPTQLSTPTPRLARGVRGEDAPASSLSIPTPEELGVAPVKKSPTLDWSATRRQLSELGVTRFALEPMAGGQMRFSCWVPNGASFQLVQGEGASESEAVRVCLERARAHHARKR